MTSGPPITFLSPKGRKIVLDVRENCPSVTDPVRRMAAEDAVEGHAVVSDYRLPATVADTPAFEKKKNGRGMRMSLLLRPAVHAHNAVLVTALATVALCRALEAHTTHRYKIRWANEICRENGRIMARVEASCSLKPDGYLHYLILDVTAYLSDAEFPTRLSEIVSEVFDGIAQGTVGRIAYDFLRIFFPLYENLSYDRSFITEYKERSALDGHHAVLLRGEKKCRVLILGIDDDARLLVETRKKEIVPVMSRAELILH